MNINPQRAESFYEWRPQALQELDALEESKVPA
jgi:hypothetical protein